MDHCWVAPFELFWSWRQTPFIASTTCCSVLVFGSRSGNDSERALLSYQSVIYEKSIRWGMNPHSDIIIHIANHAKNTRRKFEQWRKLAIQMRVAQIPSQSLYSNSRIIIVRLFLISSHFGNMEWKSFIKEFYFVYDMRLFFCLFFDNENYKSKVYKN